MTTCEKCGKELLFGFYDHAKTLYWDGQLIYCGVLCDECFKEEIRKRMEEKNKK